MSLDSVSQAPDTRLVRRTGRHAARRLLWAESHLPAVRLCMTTPVGGESGSVQIKATGTGSNRRAGFSGLMRCGSVWACPTCSHRIGAGRSAEIAEAVRAWVSGGEGRSVALLTLTMRHHDGQSLASLWQGLTDAWGKVTSGRGWTDDQALYGSPVTRKVVQGANRGRTVTESRIPFVRAVEVTHGAQGWHIHVHAVLFLGRTTAGRVLESVDRQSLAGSMFTRWADSLVSAGFARPLWIAQDCKAFTGTSAPDVLGDYFTKATEFAQVPVVDGAQRIGWEAGLGAHKSARGLNRTPFQVLADVLALGDVSDLQLWHEWESGSKGRRQVTWSTGLRDLLALEAEASDADLVQAADPDGDVLAVLTAAEWTAVRYDLPLLLARAESDDSGANLRAYLADKLYPDQT